MELARFGWPRKCHKKSRLLSTPSPCISLDSFGGIGTFQKVTAEKNKKISGPLNSRLRLSAKRLSQFRALLLCPPCRRPRVDGAPGFRSAESIRRIPVFSNRFVCRNRFVTTEYRFIAMDYERKFILGHEAVGSARECTRRRC